MFWEEKKKRQRQAFATRRLKLMNKQTYLHENYCKVCPNNVPKDGQSPKARCGGCPIYGSLNDIGDGLIQISQEAFKIPTKLTYSTYLLLKQKEWSRPVIAKHFGIGTNALTEFVMRYEGRYVEPDSEEEIDMGRPQKGNRDKAIKLLEDTDMNLEAIMNKTGVPLSTIKKLAKKHRFTNAEEKEVELLGKAKPEKKEEEPRVGVGMESKQVEYDTPTVDKSLVFTEDNENDIEPELPTVSDAAVEPELPQDEDAPDTTEEDSDEPTANDEGDVDNSQKFMSGLNTTPAFGTAFSQGEPIIFDNEPWLTGSPFGVPADQAEVTLNFNFGVSGENLSEAEALRHLRKAISLLGSSNAKGVSLTIKMETK